MATYNRVKNDYIIETLVTGSNITLTTTNVLTSANLSASGNVTANYLIGDGSQLTNLPGTTYSNATVSSLLADFGANVISMTGNVTAGYFLGDGSQLTNLPAGNYSNANVVSLLATFGSNTVSTTGNITANYFLGDGSQLTNLPAGNYSNANVASFLGALGSNSVSTTGNVTGTYILGNGSFLTGVAGSSSNSISNGLTTVSIPASAGNIEITVGFSTNVAVFTSAGLTLANNLTTNSVTATNNISATGNIQGANFNTLGLVSAGGNVTGSYIIGDGSLLTNVGVASSYGNANVAAYLPTYTGNLSGGNLSVTGQSNVLGNINVHNTARVNGVVQGQLYGLTNGVNTLYGTWDFGFITANTYNNPIQWIFAQTAAGNVDMGNITAPASLYIDIGTIF
jgi:hypothetical protein